MTTYFSFAEDSDAISLSGSAAGVEESKKTNEMFFHQISQTLLSSDSSTVWEGVDDNNSGSGKQARGVDDAVSADDSASFGGMKCTGAIVNGVFSNAIISSEVAITVADEEESLASNSPSCGAASVLTLDTALQSLKGLALVDDYAFSFESSSLRVPPPPPPPPGPPPVTALPQEPCDSVRGQTSASSSIAPEANNFEENSEGPLASTRLEEKTEGASEGEKTTTVADLTFIDRAIGPEIPIDVGEGRGTMTEDVTNDHCDQANMTNEPPELEVQGIMTEDIMPIDLVERKVATLCTCVHQLLTNIDRLALGATFPGDKGHGIETRVLRMQEIDPLSPPTLENLARHIDELSKVTSSNTNVWNRRLKRSSLQNQSFQKEQRRWRRENGSLRDEIRHLKMQAAESVSHHKMSADALQEENERLRGELNHMKEEARGAFPTDKMSAIALATAIHRGPKPLTHPFRSKCKEEHCAGKRSLP